MLSFIKKIDQNLLKNKPAFWSTRLIYVAFFSVITLAVVAVISRLILPHPLADEDMVTPTVFVSLLCGIGIIIWLVYLLRFNVFKKFATKSSGQFVGQFVIYFLSFLLMISPAFVPTFVEWLVANNKYPDVTIANDVNFVNDAITRLEAKDLKKAFSCAYYKVDSSLDRRVSELSEGYDEEVVEQSIGEVVSNDGSEALPQKSKNDSNIYRISSRLLKEKQLSDDSIEQIGPNFYKRYNYPSCNHLNPYNGSLNFENKLLTSKELVNKYLWKIVPVKDTIALQQQVLAVLKKYAYNDKNMSNFNNVDYGKKDQFDVMESVSLQQKYRIDEVADEISNVLSKKTHYDKKNLPIVFRIAFYIAFVLALLLLIFRHTTVKTFFLSILSAIILMILTGVIIALSRAEGLHALAFGLVYYVIFGAMAISIFAAKKQGYAQGIALNLTTFFLPFLPLLVLFFLGEYYQKLYGYKHYYDTYIGKNFDFLTHIAEIAGIVLALISMHLLLRKLYRRWYALPVD